MKKVRHNVDGSVYLPETKEELLFLERAEKEGLVERRRLQLYSVGTIYTSDPSKSKHEDIYVG